MPIIGVGTQGASGSRVGHTPPCVAVVWMPSWVSLVALAGPTAYRRVVTVAGKVVRLLVAAVLLAVLLTAQLGRHDDWWPLGMLGQYAVARDPDGEVVDTYLVGEFADGTRAELALRASQTGITRVELELALDELEDDDSRLADVARAYERAHPGTEVSALEVRQLVHRLRDGGRAGDPADRLVLRWENP